MLVLLLFLSTSTIGIMGALDEEIKMFKEEMKITRVDTIAQRVFYKGVMENKDVVIVKTEVGKVNAALTTQLLIDKFGVEKIIFTGIAGGIEPKVAPGDIVISTQLTYHDFGTITPLGFSLFDFSPILADSVLIEIARVASEKIDFPPLPKEITGDESNIPKVFLGTIVTGDQFIASSKKRKWLRKKFKAYAVEMEGASVAHVCKANDIPFVIIRSISDLADEGARIDIEKFKSYAARNSASIVKQMLHRLDK
jgi:adenosylhomocysteine nucleosidase